MPVSPSILTPLLTLYQTYSTSTKDEEFFVGERRKIKVLVDAIWEQVTESLFKQKPRNYTDARRILIAKKSDLKEVDDQQLAEALIVLLRDYEVLIETGYINVVEKMRPFFLIRLKGLCLNLALHSHFIGNQNAIALRERVKDL